MLPKITKATVIILITVGAIVSFYWNPRGIDMEFLRTLLGGIVGYYIGNKNLIKNYNNKIKGNYATRKQRKKDDMD